MTDEHTTGPTEPKVEYYEKHYSEEQFWGKLASYALTAGRNVVEKALQLYYTATGKETPTWARALIFGALGYFILPIDAIPDILPVVGYTDDLAMLATVITTVGALIKPEHKDQARQVLLRWFRDSVRDRPPAG